MSLKIFITILFLFSFALTSVSHADKPVLSKIKKDAYPNLKIILRTNGLLLNPKIWERIN